MGKLTATLNVDGVDVADGSIEAVEIFGRLLREAYSALTDASTLVAYCPDVIEKKWRADRLAIDLKLSKLLGEVERFETDYAERGLASAVEDASFRGDLS